MKLELKKKKKIEVNQEKRAYINYAYIEEITYWKKAVLERISTESEEKELVDLSPLRVSLIRKIRVQRPQTLTKQSFT